MLILTFALILIWSWIPMFWGNWQKLFELLYEQGSTYIFEALSGNFILSQPYVRWINMNTYSPTNFPSPWDDIFITVTENNRFVWNNSFLDPTSIHLLEFSNFDSRIKCKLCSKLTMEARDIVLVSLLSTLNIFCMFFKCFIADFEHVITWWNTLCHNLNISICFRVGFYEPCHIEDETLCNNSHQQFPGLTYFCHKELHLRCCYGAWIKYCILIDENPKGYLGTPPWLSAILGK